MPVEIASIVYRVVRVGMIVSVSRSLHEISLPVIPEVTKLGAARVVRHVDWVRPRPESTLYYCSILRAQ